MRIYIPTDIKEVVIAESEAVGMSATQFIIACVMHVVKNKGTEAASNNDKDVYNEDSEPADIDNSDS